MKQLVIFILSILPFAGMAAEAGDTTIVINGKNIVIPDSIIMSQLNKADTAANVKDTTIVVNGKNIEISDSAGLTKVSVYRNDGKELNRVYETSYTNGQEIQRIYITSPFIPQKFDRDKTKLVAHSPVFFMGFSQLGGSIMSFGGNPGMHTRDSKSWEYGFTLAELAIRIKNPFVFMSAFEIGQVHHHFQDNYVLSTVDGISSMRQVEGKSLKKSYISYTYIRLPFMVEWQPRTTGPNLFVAVGPSLELRWNDHSRYRVGKNKTTESSDINMNPIGLDLNLRVGFGALVIYTRMGLTPLLKTSVAPKCYPVSLGLGICL